MGLANIANTSNSIGAKRHMNITSYIQAIQQNWFIQAGSEDEDVLPPSLLAGVPVNCLPAGIVKAVHELSTLTIGQRERAHDLVNTYFQARIREGSYSGKSQNIFAILEIDDVEKACESLRRMSRGREMQGPVPVKEDETRKRKYSIRHEVDANNRDDDENSEKMAKRLKEELNIIPEDDNEPTTPLSINLSGILTPPDSQKTMTHASIPTTPRTQRRARLPPIRTTQINTPTPTPSQNISFTPLFNSLKHEFGDPDTPCPNRPGTYPQLDNSNVWDSFRGGRYEVPPKDPRIQAAQRATHEFNVRRIEVIEAQRAFEEARRRFGEAKRRMDGARGKYGWR
ncbi:hypothetical protein G6011_03833 [Alternaria panax]|uniref:Uncharacterized protein n=1 Tax=Alternaria panax TaxID=48097 RepID=A0AAD4IG39_9PLEO|nr:hypothetical protein G6011_03833 [Alternaria panax]